VKYGTVEGTNRMADVSWSLSFDVLLLTCSTFKGTQVAVIKLDGENRTVTLPYVLVVLSPSAVCTDVSVQCLQHLKSKLTVHK
jgi:hypothetical protein